ncbi:MULTISPECIES: hypothetical protein [Microcoleus]|uniref:Uncharacterized protein n=1 Tax=Microcoleus anatoxicus PTRS2 TaxID=2705321 RepID=A0ABU8YK24_9CYAN
MVNTYQTRASTPRFMSRDRGIKVGFVLIDIGDLGDWQVEVFGNETLVNSADRVAE